MAKFDQSGKFKNATRFQSAVFEQFCAANPGWQDRIFGKHHYYCKKLELSSFNSSDFKKDKIKYESIWKDFISIRTNLIETELDSLFIKLGCNGKDIKYFKSFFNYKRNQCALLPTNGDFYYHLFSNNFEKYKQVFDYFSSKNRKNKRNGLHPILRYFLIWNGVFMLVNSTLSGFDGIIHKVYSVIDSRNKKKKTNDKLDVGLIEKYFAPFIVTKFCQTNIFGNYVNSFDLARIEDKETKGEITKKNKETVGNCQKVIFNNDLEDLKRLFKYSIQDVGNIDSYTSDKNCGLSNFIINRIAFVAFHDLSVKVNNSIGNDSNKNGTSEEQEERLFPNLQAMFEFIYNFGIYCHCYPNTEGEQSFYISQYYDYRNKLIDMTSHGFEAKLEDFNYFNINVNDDYNGTLLHRASMNNHRQYCEVLLKNGFDCNKYNRKLHKYKRKTPFDIAKKQNNMAIVSLMEVTFALPVLVVFFIIIVLFCVFGVVVARMKQKQMKEATCQTSKLLMKVVTVL